MAIAPGEAALAIIGISTIIKNQPFKVNVGVLKQITDVDQRITQLAKELAAGTLPEPEMPRIHNYRVTLDRLSMPLPAHEIQGLVDRFPQNQSDMAGEFVLAVTNAYDHLKDLFPISSYSTFVGPVQLQPDADRVFTFFLQLQVLQNPFQVFPLIGAGAIQPPQVVAMRSLFPSFSDAVDRAIYAAGADARANKRSYNLPPKAEIGVATWLGRRIVDFDPNPTPQIVPSAKTGSPTIKLPSTLETAGQRASNPSAT